MSVLDGDKYKLEQYVVTLAEEMGLKDWRFSVEIGPVSSDHVTGRNLEAGAQIEPLWANRSAVITFAPGWQDRTLEDVRETVVHELVHAHLSQFTWTAETVEGQLGSAAYGVFEGAMHMTDEYATEAISRAWAERLPLPVWEPETEADEIERIHG